MNYKPITQDLIRWQPIIRCEDCGGAAEMVKATKEEMDRYDCGGGCCGVAFVCCLCGQRWAGSYPAPDID